MTALAVVEDLTFPPKLVPRLLLKLSEGGVGMARKRYNEEDILRLLREIEVHLHGGMDVVSACRTAGISDKTYYGWRKRYGGMGRAKLTELKALEKENQRLKKILAELELDKLILKESLDYLKPRA
ncbi:MAG: transposase [Planktomarina sp.]|nr:transposase [Planktomarina sp.]